MNRLIALGLISVCAVGCDSMVTSPSRYTAVEVHAARRDGSPIGGVPLVLYTGPRIMGYDTTNAQGLARFARVPEGEYGVYAGEPAGYQFPERLLGGAATNYVDRLNLYHDSTQTVRFRLLKIGAGTVTARVVDPSGTPVAGADVELYRLDAVLRRSRTAPDGGVIFLAVPYGLYGVRTGCPAEYQDLEPALVWQYGLVVEDGVTTDGQLTLQGCRGTINLRVLR